MDELTLEPYAVTQHWRLPAADSHWESILEEYLQTIAQRCTSAGKCVIGHIKALALFPNDGFFRISVVTANHPATIEGAIPAGCRDLELILNVLVYGLGRNILEQITEETANEIASRRQGTVSHIKTGPAGELRHHSNHE